MYKSEAGVKYILQSLSTLLTNLGHSYSTKPEGNQVSGSLLSPLSCSSLPCPVSTRVLRSTLKASRLHDKHSSNEPPPRPHQFFLLLLFWYFETRFFSSYGGSPGTGSVEQAGICLPSARIKGMCHHRRLFLILLNDYVLL